MIKKPMYTRQEAQEYLREMLTGHNPNATHNMYSDTAGAMDDIYDGVEEEIARLKRTIKELRNEP